MNDVTARFAHYAARTSADWPDEALRRAANAVLDTVACALAGSGDEAPRGVARALAGWADGGRSSLIGRPGTLPAPLAAMVNGAAAHALDYDDVLEPAASHVSAVLVPALLALGEERGTTGRAILDAYLVGFEIQACLGEAMNMAHYSRGWHTTLTLGAPAAAAACGRLIGLDEARMANAISLATSLAGGSKRQFGTMMKPIHAGLGAQAGVMAATLAQAGITAAAEAFAGPWSFEDMYGGAGAPGFARVLENLGRRIAMIDYGTCVKAYPCCASTHRSIDAVLSLQREYGFGADEVLGVETRVSEVALRNLMYTAPENEMQARFSMNHCLALVIANAAVRIEDFSLAALARPELRRLWPRVTMTLDPELPGSMAAEPGRERQTATVRLSDGRTLSKTVVLPKGHGKAPLTDAELVPKFNDCAARALSADARSSALAALANFASLPRVADLTRYLNVNQGVSDVDRIARQAETEHPR